MEIEEEQHPKQNGEGTIVGENLTQIAEQANDCIPIPIDLEQNKAIEIVKIHEPSGLASEKPTIKNDNLNQTKSKAMKNPARNKKRISELK